MKFSRWITPAEVQIRFDTHFFLAPLPDGQEPTIDGDEIVDHGWFTPPGALAAHERGEIALVFPTIKHLEQLSGFATADALLSFARGREVGPVQPRIVTEGETARLLLPGRAGLRRLTPVTRRRPGRARGATRRSAPRPPAGTRAAARPC